MAPRSRCALPQRPRPPLPPRPACDAISLIREPELRERERRRGKREAAAQKLKIFVTHSVQRATVADDYSRKI